MTVSSHPPAKVEWEPIIDGVDLIVNDTSFWLNMISVRELRDDMEHASMLARGLEKTECFFMEIDKDDWLVLMGDAYRVSSTLEGRDGWVCEIQLNAYSADLSEITFPPDQMVTVWRPIG